MKAYTLANGLRLVVNEMPGLMSVSMGILVGAGGAYESDSEDGISHYIEHMQFKGTKTRTAEEISAGFDDIGAQVNAFTGKDMTCYYAKSTTAKAEEAFALLCDLFLNATFPEEEAAREKEVICEEISMNEDSPEDVCLDLLSFALYGKEGYGRNILGTQDNVRSFTKADVDAYKDKLYRPENIVLSFAGALPFEKAKEWTEKYFSSLEGGKFIKPEKKILFPRAALYKKKPIEQAHIALAFPGFARGDERGEAAQMMNVVVGSGMSSRLFMQVREKMGLAYSVYSYGTVYSECGHFTIYAGVSPKNAEKAYAAVLDVLDGIKKEGFSQAEFSRAREQIRSNNVFSQENTSSQMLYFGRNLLHRGVVESYKEQEARFDRVRKEDMEEVFAATLGAGVSASALVGNDACPLFR